VQAVLTWFPSDDDPLDAGGQISDPDDDASESGGYISEGSDRNKRKPEWEDDFTAKKRPNTWNSKTRSYATQLGSFPDARGGRTVGGGVGDVGLSIADGDEVDEKNVGGMARALVVFLKTRAFAYFLSGTMHVVFLPFEIQHAVPAARGLILERKINIPPPPPSFTTGNSYSLRPPVNTKDAPRLFTLMDPLSEVGLVTTTVNTPSTENLLFISPSSELVSASGQDDPSRGWSTSKTAEVLFAVTYNAEKFQFTVWQVRYTHREPSMVATQRAPSVSGSMSARRRSSFGPGTGATTPVAGGGPGSIVSSGTLVGRPSRDSLNANDASSLNVLGEDFQTTGRRSSRRISSMMARADLSGNHEASHRFSDVSTSLGASFNAPPPPPQNTMIVDDEPVDDLLEELNMGSLGMEDMGAYVGEGLNHELVMHKIESFPARLSDNIIPRENSAARVFTLRGPSSMSAATLTQKEPPGQTVVMYIMNRNEATLLQLTFQIQVHSAIPKGYPRRSSTKYGPVAMGYTPALIDIQKRDDVLDAIKIQDGGLEKVLILTDDSKFLLYAPRGPVMDIILPPTMARWNPNVIGEDGSRRGSRKKEFARTLSTTPDRYQMLQYSEPGGRVSVIDGEFVSHRINIMMAPREVATKSCLETLRVVMGAEFGAHVGEGLWSAWMTVAKWLQSDSEPEAALAHSHDSKGMSPADEWEAFVVTLFILAVPMLPEPKPQARRKSAFVRSVSMVAEREWEDLATHEGDWGSAPEYLRDPAWQWMLDEQEEKAAKHQQTLPRGKGTLNLSSDGRLQNKFITDCVSHARKLMKSPTGDYIQHDCFGKGPNVEHLQKTALAFSLVALQILREEWKLDIAMEGPGRRLCPVLRQMAWWLRWTTWSDDFMLEDIEMAGWVYDECMFPSLFCPRGINSWLSAHHRCGGSRGTFKTA
jgi:anaphase-promoting complex subunit 1